MHATTVESALEKRRILHPSDFDASTQAVALVENLYKTKASQDPNLKVRFDHVTTIQDHSVYVVQVYDVMKSNVATLGWVEVRDDGLVQDDILQSGWVIPNQFKN